MASIPENIRDWGFFMVVYVEYAFVWNFLLDGVLLCLSLRGIKRKIKWVNVLLSALVGASFALIFPLLKLPVFCSVLLKFSVGFLLCLIAFGRVKNKKEGGMYALNCTLFFALTFIFGGAMQGVFGAKVHKGLVLLGFALLTPFSLFLIGKIYAKRAVLQSVYDCAIVYKQRRFALLGFYDSGNLARHNQTPVCFLSPDVFYDIWGEENLFSEEKTKGQVCVEILFQTLNGERKAMGREGALEVTVKGKKVRLDKVYFCPSTNMLSREYKLLLNARIFE